MDEADLVRRACETNAGFLALGNERFEAHGGTFLRNRGVPLRLDVNGIALVRSETVAEVEALLARVEVEYAGMAHRRFSLDPLTPPAFEARTSFESGYNQEQ